MEGKFSPLDPDEVISTEPDYTIAVKHQTCTTREFLSAIASALQHYSSYGASLITWNAKRHLWFMDEGVEGRALRFSEGGWQSGRLRLSIEFCPDEPEPEPETSELPLLEASIEPANSPLDEIRRLAEE